MNTPRIVGWSLALALLAGSALWLGLLATSARELRGSEERAFAALEMNRRFAAAILRPHKKDEMPNSESKVTTGAAMADAAAPKTNARAIDPQVNFGHQIAVALSHMPEFAPLRRAEVHRWVMREYGEWLGQLKVPVERLAAVKEVMTDFRLDMQDAYDSLVNGGYRQGTPEFDAPYARYLKEGDDLLRAKLSADEYASYRDFAKARSWTSRMPDLVAYLEERGVPALSAEQKSALTAAYVAAGASKPEGAVGAAVLYRMQHDRMAQLIEPALSPGQYEAVRGYLKYLNDRSRILGRLLHPSAPDAYIITPGN